MQKLAIAAAFVAVAAIGVALWIGRAGPNGTVGASMAPSPVATTNTTPKPTPNATQRTLGGVDQGLELAAGTYRAGDPFNSPFTFGVSDGWKLGRIEQNSAVILWPSPPNSNLWAATLTVLRPDRIYRDPCNPDLGSTSVETLDDVVAALTSMPGFAAGPITDTEIGGESGKSFSLVHEVDAQCPEGVGLTLMTYERFGLQEPIYSDPAGHDRIWVVSVDGQPLVIDVSSFETTTAVQELAADAVVATIKFE